MSAAKAAARNGEKWRRLAFRLVRRGVAASVGRRAVLFAGHLPAPTSSINDELAPDAGPVFLRCALWPSTTAYRSMANGGRQCRDSEVPLTRFSRAAVACRPIPEGGGLDFWIGQRHRVSILFLLRNFDDPVWPCGAFETLGASVSEI